MSVRSLRTRAVLLALAPAALTAQAPVVPVTTQQQFAADRSLTVPPLQPMANAKGSELAEIVSRYSADLNVLQRRYDGAGSPAQRPRLRAFYTTWRTRLSALDFGKLSQEGRVDYVLLDNHLRYQLDLLDRDEVQRRETAPLLPFADRLLALHDARRDLKSIDGQTAARTIADVTHVVDSLRALYEPAPARPAGDSAAAKSTPRATPPKVSRTIANRAADQLDELRNSTGQWFRYYNGYDPMFSWWVANPQQKLDKALRRYAQTIRQRVVGIPPAPVVAQGTGSSAVSASAQNTGPIIGDPIGADGLAADLRHAMVPYTADELIVIAEKEYAFSLSEAKKAARELGFGDDWKAAMAKVKDMYVEPGKQPDLIRDLANEADAFFAKHDWVTIPELAREDWRMEMMTPERQRVNPFFLGGDMIIVSYPTADMTDEEKLMSLRGNNPYFSRAVVFHELNPGHHLQGFMSARYNSHRRVFGTPFWNEGQSLYWEMFLWDHDFHVKPEDRLGALAWRMHRSARIVFSLSFHLGKMTPEQAIEYLVDKVPFERANAEGEVRRSFNGTYSPIYQAAYMLGGLQIRALYKELVMAGKLNDRAFHDAILQGGPMPIAMVRARLATRPLTRDGATPWRFADDLPAPRPAPERKK
ncbi:MAG: DUF885 domain-containing protein [Gemmatimonadaceae bacterium]|nr:DUF885 domain-containing protein [Gemmatimonadaceae bacterium]